MSGPAPIVPSAEPLRTRTDERFGAIVALGLGSVAVVGVQLFFLVSGGLSPTTANLGFLAVQGALVGLWVLGARLDGRPLRLFGLLRTEPVAGTLPLVMLLLLVVVALQLDPGFFLGFARAPLLPPGVFAYFLVLAPVMALGQAGLFLGYVFRSLARALPLRVAIVVSSAVFALFSSNLDSLVSLSPPTAFEFLVRTTVVYFVLGLVLAVYFYKVKWGLLGPTAFSAGYFAITTLLPWTVAYGTWEYEFAAELTAFAVVLVVIGFGLREPGLQSVTYLGTRNGPQRLRFLHRRQDREAMRETLVTAAVVGVAALTFSYGLPVVLDTSSPVLAIATGSMTPTLPRGELVVIHHVAPTSITVGTVIAFHVSCLPAPTVHRVIRIVSTGPNWVYQTKGDANPSEDPCTVPYSQVLGAVAVALPYLGFLVLDPLFAAALVVVVMVGALAWREERR